MKQLKLIDLSANVFTGSIPSDLFEHSLLETVSLTENCFTGYVPLTICSSKTLKTLLLDGLRTGNTCRKSIWDPLDLFSGYYSDGISGSVPACLFGMTQLEILHLSGNGLAGKIDASRLKKGSKLFALALSNNRLSGSIPDQLQRWPLSLLDLQQNSLSGTLDYMGPNSSKMHLKLEGNHISGRIPAVIRENEKIAILLGNLFYCRHNSGDLPRHDHHRDDYTCGSNALDLTLLLSLCFFGFMLLIGILLSVLVVLNRRMEAILTAPRNCFDWIGDKASYLRRCISASTNRTISPQFMKDKESGSHSYSVPNTQLFLETLISLRNWNSIVLLIIGLILTPLYILFKNISDFSTHSHTYSWVVSGLYVKGVPPTLAIFFVWLIIVSAVTVLAYQRHANIRDDQTFSGIKREPYSLFQRIAMLSNSALFVVIAMLITNLVVIFGVMSIYVYTTLSNAPSSVKTISQILLAAFKLFWNNLVVPRCIAYITGRWSGLVDDKSWINVVVLIFNNVVAPCLVSSLGDTSCFYYAFAESPKISSGYSYVLCDIYDVLRPDTCLVFRSFGYQSTFHPPFIYNFECTSALFKNFIPVYMYNYVFLAFVDPLIFAYLCSIHSRDVNGLVRNALPGILWPEESHALEPKKIMKADRVMYAQLNHVAVLLTFGVIFPPLAALITLTSIVVALKWQIIIGRYLLHFTDGKDASVSEVGRGIDWRSVLDFLCIQLWRAPWVVHWAIVWQSSIFFAFYFMDIAAKETGLVNSLWIFCLPLASSALLWALWHLWRYWFAPNLFEKSAENQVIVNNTWHRLSLFRYKSNISIHSNQADGVELKSGIRDQNVHAASNEISADLKDEGRNIKLSVSGKNPLHFRSIT